MNPQMLAAFTDEMEKIAISMPLVEKATAAAWGKGLTGSRMLPKALGEGVPHSSTEHILQMAGRKTKKINPVLHPIDRAKGEMSLRRMEGNASRSEDARSWTSANPGQNPSQNPRIAQPGKRYAGDSGSHVVDSPGGEPVPLSATKTGPFSHGKAHAKQYEEETKAFAAHKARQDALPPEKAFNPARASLLASRARPAAVPPRPTTTSTAMPARFPPVSTTIPAPGQRPTPASPVQRRPFVSRTPQIQPQQPGVAF